MKVNQLFAFFVLALLLAIQAQAQSFLTNGLVAYYPFNGTVNDATGNGNDGTIVGRVSFGTNRFGQASSAIYFNGTSNNFVSTPLMPPSGRSSRTFSVWFNTASVAQANRSTLNTLGTMISYGDFGNYVGSGIDAGITSGGWLQCDTSISGFITDSIKNDGKWHNLVVVIPTNSTLGQLQFFIDGVNQNKTNPDNPTLIGTYPTQLVIGTSIRGTSTGRTTITWAHLATFAFTTGLCRQTK